MQQLRRPARTEVNRSDCPQMQGCSECGETGHSANKFPIRPCKSCGLRSHELQTSHSCSVLSIPRAGITSNEIYVTRPGRSCHPSLPRVKVTSTSGPRAAFQGRPRVASIIAIDLLKIHQFSLVFLTFKCHSKLCCKKHD